jgi:hypothetical protein
MNLNEVRCIQANVAAGNFSDYDRSCHSQDPVSLTPDCAIVLSLSIVCTNLQVRVCYRRDTSLSALYILVTTQLLMEGWLQLQLQLRRSH